jgi:monovalent cation:H+ antiporter-2, CPA2 family
VKIFGYKTSTAARVAIGLTQIGEFSFILAQVSLRAGLITPAIYNATLFKVFVKKGTVAKAAG